METFFSVQSETNHFPLKIDSFVNSFIGTNVPWERVDFHNTINVLHSEKISTFVIAISFHPGLTFATSNPSQPKYLELIAHSDIELFMCSFESC
jgi:hypothetical protein